MKWYLGCLVAGAVTGTAIAAYAGGNLLFGAIIGTAGGLSVAIVERGNRP